jgi:hypothetical protein
MTLKKVPETPSQKMHRYSQTGEHLTQKYFGISRHMQEANQIIFSDSMSGIQHGVPLSNYMNAQVSIKNYG